MISVDENQSFDKPAEERIFQPHLGFYNKRNRFYTLLMLFVVVVGLPIVGVPKLRNRLSARVMLLKTAVAGNVVPVVAQVGANSEPFPSEYERPAPPVPQVFKLPPPAAVYPQTPRASIPSPPGSSKAPDSTKPDIEESLSQPEGGESLAQDGAEPAESEESGPKYQQGEIEQEAYNLVLKSNAKIAEMVRGSDPSLHFESWDVAKISDDVFWVRVKFKSAGNPDREYIWQVKLGSNEITPLSYHARSIS